MLSIGIERGTNYDPQKPITALTSLECVEPEIQSLHNACNQWEENFTVTKIAQGSYATILRMQMKDEPDVYTVWKLIPLKNKTGKGCRALGQTFIEDSAAEVKALALMAEIEGFVEFRSARVLRGSLPPLLQNLNTRWQISHPDEETEIKYSKEQQWLLVEMSDAGTDLETLIKKGFSVGELLPIAEKGVKLTIQQTWDIFWATAEALARGEALANFEHRDLHPGNICISKRTTPPADPNQHTVQKHTDLEVTIIDYTLSRATLENGEVLANSMKDGSIFEQSSLDPTDDRQYGMYRHMRSLIDSDPSVPQERKWHQYVPMTNIIWLYHILKYLLDNTAPFPKKQPRKAPTISPEERKMNKHLAQILARMDPVDVSEWRYRSAADVVGEEVAFENGIWHALSSSSDISDVRDGSVTVVEYRRAMLSTRRGDGRRRRDGGVVG